MLSVPRSLIFYAVFYAGSIFWVLVALLALPLGDEPLRRVADGWSAFHRACVRGILGIVVRKEGKRAAGPALYAFKHESFFEAIDLAVSLHRPVIFAKEELFKIPGWGRVAQTHGAVPVARDAGAKALRTMIAEALRYARSG